MKEGLYTVVSNLIASTLNLFQVGILGRHGLRGGWIFDFFEIPNWLVVSTGYIVGRLADVGSCQFLQVFTRSGWYEGGGICIGWFKTGGLSFKLISGTVNCCLWQPCFNRGGIFRSPFFELRNSVLERSFFLLGEVRCTLGQQFMKQRPWANFLHRDLWGRIQHSSRQMPLK